MVSNYAVVRKDVKNDDILRILSLESIVDNYFLKVLTDSYLSVEIDLRREIEYFRSEIGSDLIHNVTDIVEFLEINRNFLNDKKLTIVIINDRILGSLWMSHISNVSDQFIEIIRTEKQEKKNNILSQSDKTNNIFTCKILSRNDGGFFVDIKGVPAFLPGSLAGANKITNFDTLIGTELPVMLEDYLRDSNTYIVSHKKYIETILPTKINELIENKMTIKYTGVVTGCAKFGLFVEFNKIFTGLLHFSGMNSEFYSRFRNGDFIPGDEVEFYVKNVDEKNRIILCTDNLNMDPWQDFKTNCEGQYLKGEIFNITNFGVFVKFEYNKESFRGLFLFKTLTPEQRAMNIEFKPYTEKTFFIDRVNVDEKRIFLAM